MAEQAEIGERGPDLKRKAALRRLLGDTAGKAEKKLNKLVEKKKELPQKILTKQRQVGEARGEFEAADAELFEAVNTALLDGSIGIDDALGYFGIPVEERAAHEEAFHAIVDPLRVGPYAISDTEQGVIWGTLAEDPTPYMVYRDSGIAVGARVVLDNDSESTAAIVPPQPRVGEGFLSDRAIWSSVLGRRPFSDAGLETKFDLHELIAVGNGLDALEFVGGKQNKADARYQAIEHGIERIINLKEQEDGSLTLTRFIVPKVNGNAAEVWAALQVMQKHFPNSYKVLYENLAKCMAHEPDQAVKQNTLYNPSLALDLAAVMNFKPPFSQEQRMAAGQTMVHVGSALLAQSGVEQSAQ